VSQQIASLQENSGFEIIDTQGVPIMLQTILREEKKKHMEKPLNLLRAVD
jgi:hypothetical protein